MKEYVSWNDFIISYTRPTFFSYSFTVTRQGDEKPLFKKTMDNCNFPMMLEKVKEICEKKYKSYMI